MLPKKGSVSWAQNFQGSLAPCSGPQASHSGPLPSLGASPPPWLYHKAPSNSEGYFLSFSLHEPPSPRPSSWQAHPRRLWWPRPLLGAHPIATHWPVGPSTTLPHRPNWSWGPSPVPILGSRHTEGEVSLGALPVGPPFQVSLCPAGCIRNQGLAWVEQDLARRQILFCPGWPSCHTPSDPTEGLSYRDRGPSGWTRPAAELVMCLLDLAETGDSLCPDPSP